MQTITFITQFAALLATLAAAHHVTTRALAFNATYRAKVAASKQFREEAQQFIDPLCDALRQGDHTKANEIRRTAQQHADRFTKSL